MKMFVIIGLVLLGTLLFGCTQQEQPKQDINFLDGNANHLNLDNNVLGYFNEASDIGLNPISRDMNLIINSGDDKEILVINNFSPDWNIIGKRVFLNSHDTNNLCFVYDGRNWNKC